MGSSVIPDFRDSTLMPPFTPPDSVTMISDPCLRSKRRAYNNPALFLEPLTEMFYSVALGFSQQGGTILPCGQHSTGLGIGREVSSRETTLSCFIELTSHSTYP